MKKTLVAALTFLFLCFVYTALAPAISANTPLKVSYTEWDIKPVVLSTTHTDISSLTGGPPASTDVWICEADANSVGTATLSMFDKQGTPVAFFPAVAMTANQMFAIFTAPSVSSCRYAPGGLTVWASANTTITLHLRGVY